MPGFLLHAGATLLCPHGGQTQPVLPSPFVKVGGAAALTQPPGHTIAGCALPPPAGGPCTTVQWMSAAITVLSGGQPLLLTDSVSLCLPCSVPSQVLTTQILVRGQ
jgi:hypothetical protein